MFSLDIVKKKEYKCLSVSKELLLISGALSGTKSLSIVHRILTWAIHENKINKKFLCNKASYTCMSVTIAVAAAMGPRG